MELKMHQQYIEDMVQRLTPVLKDKAKAEQILERYWSDKMAIVWEARDIHRAANELELALTNKEAITILKNLHDQHNAQLGLKWKDITTHIEAYVLGRKLTKREVKQFVQHDRLTIQH
jgi:hypothetical protein